MEDTPDMSSPILSSASKKLRRTRRRLIVLTVLVVCAMAALEVALVFQSQPPEPGAKPSPTPSQADAGQILSRDSSAVLAPAQVEAVSHESYGAFTPKPLYGVRRTLVQYRSYDENRTPITIYARVYQPVGKTGAPIFAFAPGTVGIGDQCAPSLENPRKANWANYDSHLLTYAGQGYASVITDYEGMRDPSRIHHYMVGALEGRAVLDSVRAVINLDNGSSSLDTGNIFLAGYSQGGHSAFWADQIAEAYAPELNIKGVIGFGPVMDVQQTLADIVHAANINWFGPYVLASYSDYYEETYGVESILLPRWRQNLRADVLGHCIDTNLSYWGYTPGLVYTPEFLSSLGSGLNDPKYSQLKRRLAANITGSAQTSSAKLINEGGHDNVVLPAQQTAAMQRVCPNSVGPAQLKVYPAATHYNTMAISFNDTLAWMRNLAEGTPVASTCSP